MVNTLAYCDASKITARKRFIMLASAYFHKSVVPQNKEQGDQIGHNFTIWATF